MLAGISNILPGFGLPPVGPWWFIPFIMQFYAIWPMLRRLTNKFGGRPLWFFLWPVSLSPALPIRFWPTR